MIAKFLSGDPHITDPTNGQNYNRYSYVLNNPTNFTDPTGFDCASGKESVTGSSICFDSKEAAAKTAEANGVQGTGLARQTTTDNATGEVVSTVTVRYTSNGVEGNSSKTPSGNKGTTTNESSAQKFDDTQQKQIIGALSEQKAMLNAAKDSLTKWGDSDKEGFKTIFGTDSDQARDKVIGIINKELAVNNAISLENFRFANPDDTPGTKSSELFAYVMPGSKDRIVYLGDLFWTAPTSGYDSRGGILIHEFSHWTDIGGTLDGFPSYNGGASVYGYKSAIDLGKSRPDLSIRHADSIEYFGESR